MAISMIKGSFFGAFMTWIMAMFFGSAGMRGGVLLLHKVRLDVLDFYWSWPLFLAGTLLAAAILWMMDS